MILPELNWTVFKQQVDSRNLSIQWVSVDGIYYLTVFDGNFQLFCKISQEGNADQTDFETNYKDLGNQSLKTEVVTQFEKEDKLLQIISGEETFNNGTASLDIKVPGTPGGVEGRYIDWGEAWFDSQHNGDRISKVEVVDKDNLLGYGAGAVLKRYHDNQAATINQGWRVPKVTGVVQVDALGGYGFIPSGFYLRITGIKGESQTTGSLFANIKWGTQE